MYIQTIDYASPKAAQTFCNSIRGTGFAMLSNHPIAQSLIEAVYSDWKDFFNTDAKFDYLYDPNVIRQCGYFPFKSEKAKGYPVKDLKEFYHYRDEKDLPKGLGKNTQVLFDKMMALAEEILKWMEGMLPQEIADNLSMPLHQMIKNSEMSLLRVLHYPPIMHHDDEGAVRSAAHEDIVLLTILPAATAPGLQVLDSKNKWHEVPCDHGTLVINAGDMLQMATQGYYKSTTHRVINPVGEEAYTSRYSLPLFLHPRSEVRLSETHTAGTYLDERLKELGLKRVA